MALELATIADLQDALPDVEEGPARAAIKRASALVRAIARQQFDFVAHDTAVIAGGGQDLVLPERPLFINSDHPLTVFETSDLQGDGVRSVQGTNFALSGDRLTKRYRSQFRPACGSFETLYGQSWPAGIWAPYVRVTYSHGYLTPPEWLTAIVLNAATAYATNPGGLYSEQVGGITLTWQRSTVTARSGMVDQIKAELTAVGIRRGGAFSVAQS